MNNRRVDRRLAAIIAADIVGYSSLMGSDEVGTVAAVKAFRHRTVEPLLKRFKGRLIKTTGDGFLLEFGSVYNAFDFAASLQGGNTKGPKLRMGLNLGDIILDEGDVFGDGVIIAARLEPLSPHGGLLLSNRAWEDLRRLPIAFEDAGALALKNLAEPVQAWRVEQEQLATYAATIRDFAEEDEPTKEPASAAAVTAGGMRVSRRAVIGVAGGAVAVGIGGFAWLRSGAVQAAQSIAVLPFASLSQDKAQAYFAAGIAGEIRNKLTRVDGLRVAGSTSSEAVRSNDAQDAATKLGVSHILTGNVRQSPSMIRVTAELIDGATGLAKWSQDYDRSPGDVIKLQTDIAENVVSALRIALSPASKEELAAGETRSVAAQTLVFQARDISYLFTVPTFRQAIDLADQAIALDPGYARAWAMKSFFVNNLATMTARTASEMAAGRGEAEKYAEKALAIAPKLPIARSALAYVYTLSLRIGAALSENEAAFALAGGDPDVIRNYALSVSGIGKREEALRYVKEARKLDPLNSGSHRAYIQVLFDARRYAEAVDYSIKLQREQPEMFRFSYLLGSALLMLGRSAEAADAFGDSLRGRALLAARAGNAADAKARVDEIAAAAGDFFQYQAARTQAQLGQIEEAFAALDRAWQVRDPELGAAKTDPFLDPLRKDPRYSALLMQMGFPT